MEESISYVPSEVSAHATSLINREPILEQIRAAIADRSGQTWVFFITAPGGTGKTCLVREVLHRCQKDGLWFSPDVLAAREPVDLYHAHTHSDAGLARAIRTVLDPGPGYFEDYVQQRDRLHKVKQDLAEVMAEVVYQRERMIKAFLSDYDRAAHDFRLVLALDTVETIVHEPDRVQEALGLTQAGPGIQSWLVETLVPQMRNTVLLVAGRPESAPLGEDLRRISNLRFEPVELAPFQEKDTLEYFQAVAALARQAGQEEAAARIEAIPEETRRVIHRYTGGRPILIALLIDYLAVADRLLPAVQVTLEEAIRQTPDEESLRQVHERLEADVVRVLQETGRDTDDTLRALAWAPKGMDAELLAHVSLLGPVIADDVARAAEALKKVRLLSFVKVRPADQRVFLHDEAYSLFERHVLSRATEERRARVHEAILKYYARKVEEARRAIDPAAGAEALADAYASLHNAQVEEMYYSLRDNAIAGFQTYYRYAEEAFQTNTPELDQQLRDELLRYLRRQEKGQEVDGLSRREVERDLAIRLVKWNVLRSKWDEAVKQAQQLREKLGDLVADPLSDAELSVFEGWALIYQGQNLLRAEELLQQASTTLEKLGPADELQTWRATIALAYAHNHLGYLYRNQGRFREAVQEYRRALPYWRQHPELAAAHSDTLNNLAWACAESGDFLAATRHAHDALEMRRRLGRRYLVALSLNTLGLIETRDGKPDRARHRCEQALTIFRDLEQRRGIGLACVALAEALRREAAIPDLHSPAEAADLLRQAERYAREAMNIFQEEHKEPARLVEALLELGCIYRDWATIRDRYDHPYDEPRLKLAEQGERTLRRAAREAGDRFLHRQVDALVNLAWLHYYIGDADGARRVIETEVFSLVSAYRIVEEAGIPHVENPIAFLWTQLGKAQALLGHIAFDAYAKANERYRHTRNPADLQAAREHLHTAASEWTLALAYDYLFAPDFRDLRRGLDRIYRNMRTLNVEEMQVVYRAIGETADKHALARPPVLQTYLEEAFGVPTTVGGNA